MQPIIIRARAFSEQLLVRKLHVSAAVCQLCACNAGVCNRSHSCLLLVLVLMFPCPYCAGFLGRTFKKLLSHIKFNHSHEPNFCITCADCGKSFRKFASFKSHLQREEKRKEQAAILPPHLEENDDHEYSDDGDSDEEEEPENYIEDLTRFLALFILKTKEENQLSQQTINAIIENTGDLVESSLEALKKNIRSCLKDNDIEIADVEGLSDVLEQPSAFSQAKEPLTNEYLQVRYFVENFNFVVSITSYLYLLHLVQGSLFCCHGNQLCH